MCLVHIVSTSIAALCPLARCCRSRCQSSRSTEQPPSHAKGLAGNANLSELLDLSGLVRQSRAAAAMQRWSDAVSDVVRSLDLDEDDPRLAALNDQSNGMVEAFEAMLDEQLLRLAAALRNSERPASRRQKGPLRTLSIKRGER